MKANDFFTRLKQDFHNLVSVSDHVDVVSAADNIRAGIPFRGPNVFILFCAIMVASLGLNVNSIPVIIGAMLISPLMGPIIGLGLALGTNDIKLLRHALSQLTVMVLISILGATLYFVLTPLDMAQPSELLARTNPTIYDVLIALFGGFAGIVEISRKDKGTVMSGVAIATALMPPLCTVGYGIAQLNWHYAVGALYLFFINSVFIATATFVMVKYLGYPVVHETDPKRERRRTATIWLVLTIILIPSIISAITIIRENNTSRNATKLVSANKTIGKSYIYDYKIGSGTNPQIDLYMAGEKLTTDQREDFYSLAEQQGFTRSQIVFHEEAVTDFTPFNQEEIIKDIFANHEQQIKERDERIQALEAQLTEQKALYAASQLPTEQLAREIQTQYSAVKTITLARGEQSGDTVQQQIVVVLHYQEPTTKQKKTVTLADKEKAQLNEWLRVRLNTENVVVL